MTEVKTKVAWSPQPGPQTWLLTCPIQDIFFGGARGGGKTDALLGDWLTHANTHGKNARGLIVRQTMPELDDVVARSHDIYPISGAVFQSQSKTWVWPSGAYLRMRYLETVADAGRYQGHRYSWLGVDEAGQYPSPEVIDRLRACLRSPEGVPCVMRLTGNPGGPGHEWLKQRYVTPAKPKQPHKDENGNMRVFIPSKLSDNAVMVKGDPDYVNRVKSSGPAWLVRAWLDGDWDSEPTGGFFSPEKISVASLPELERVYQAWDLAVTEESRNSGDYSACATVGRDKLGRFWLIDMLKGRWNASDVTDRIIEQYRKFKPLRVWVEGGPIGRSIEPFLRNRLVERGLGGIPWQLVPPGRKDKVTRATPVQAIIEAGQMYRPFGATWWSDLAREMSTFPTSPHDDQIDALAWACINLQSIAPNDVASPIARLVNTSSHASTLTISGEDLMRLGAQRRVEPADYEPY